MALKQVGKVRAVSVAAVLVGESTLAYGPSWIITVNLVLAPLVILVALIFIIAIFGGNKLSARAFRLIHLLFVGMRNKRDLFPHRLGELGPIYTDRTITRSMNSAIIP